MSKYMTPAEMKQIEDNLNQAFHETRENQRMSWLDVTKGIPRYECCECGLSYNTSFYNYPLGNGIMGYRGFIL